MNQYWPGNLTLVFNYDDPQFAGIKNGNKVALRVPSDPALRALISLLGEPLISTSVNVSGLMPEENYERIVRNYDSWFDFALLPSSREMKRPSEPSTIIEYIGSEESGSNDDISVSTTGSDVCLFSQYLSFSNGGKAIPQND